MNAVSRYSLLQGHSWRELLFSKEPAVGRISPDKMWKGKDCMEDEEEGAEDRPVKLVEETQVWATTFHQTLEMGWDGRSYHNI